MLRQVLSLRLNGGIVRNGIESAAAGAASAHVANDTAININKCPAFIKPDLWLGARA
jgi:hypothetical protein